MTTKYVITADNTKMLNALKEQNKLVLESNDYMTKMGTTIDSVFGRQSSGSQKAIVVTLENLNSVLKKNAQTAGEAKAQNLALLKIRLQLKPAIASEQKSIEDINKKLQSNVAFIKQVEGAKKQSVSTTTAAINANNKYATSLNKQSRLLQDLTRQASIYFSVFQAQRLVGEMIKVRGEFELQNVALSAMLQNKELANEMFLQVQEMALKSPFKILELNKYLKQLKAYRIENEDLLGTLKQLGDISAGLGVSMDRLILAYGQVRAATVLRGQELRQFTEAGIPLVEQLADKFTELNGKLTTTAEVFDLISNRQVSFEMVRDIFTEMTQEGGVFFNQQALQAETLSGQLSVLRDAFDKMLNSMGKANEGVLKGGISGLRYLVDNYEELWAVINKLIIAYGVYRTILIANVALSGKLNIALFRNIAAFKALEANVTASAKAMAFFKAYGAPVLAIVGLIVGVISAYSAKQKKLTEAMQETLHPIVIQGIELRKLQSILNDTNTTEEERIKALTDLNRANKLVNKEIFNEKSELKDLNAELEENIRLNRVKLVVTENFKDPKRGLDAIRLNFDDAKADLENFNASATKEFADLIATLQIEASKGLKFEGFDLEDFISKGANDPAKAIDEFNNRMSGSFEESGLLLRFEYEKLLDIFREEVPSNFFFDKESFESQYAIFEKAVVVAEVKARELIKNFVASGQLSQEDANKLLLDNELIEAQSKAATDQIFANWRGLTLALEGLDFGGALAQFSPEKYKDTEFEKYLDTILDSYKKVQDQLEKYKSAAISKEQALLSATDIKALADEKAELEKQEATLKQILKYWNFLPAAKKAAWSISSEDKNALSQLKEDLKLLKELRDARVKLDQAAGDEISLGIETVDYKDIFDEGEFKAAFARLKLPTDIFESFGDSEFQSVLDSYLELYEQQLNDIEGSGTKAGKAYIQKATTAMRAEIQNLGTENPLKELVDSYEDAVDVIQLRDKLLGLFAPFGDEVVFEITTETSQAENDIIAIEKKYAEAKRTVYNENGKLLTKATQEEIDAINKLRDIEIEAKRKVTDEKIKSIAESYATEELGALDQFYNNVNDATLSQMLNVNKIIKSLDTSQVDPINLIPQSQIDNLGIAKDDIDEIFAAINEGGLSDLEIIDKFSIDQKSVTYFREINRESVTFKKQIEKIRENWKEVFAPEFIKDVAEGVAEISGSIVGLGNSLSEMGESIGDSGLMDLGSTISTAATLMEGLASTIAASLAHPLAGVASAIGLVTTVISMQAQTIAEYKQAQLDFKNALNDARTEYNLWANSIIRDTRYVNLALGQLQETTSVFGVDNPFSNAISGANAYKDILDKLGEITYQIGEDNTYGYSTAGVKQISDAKLELVSLEDALNRIGKIQDGTEQYGGFLGIGEKTRETYESLKEALGADEIDIFSKEQLQKALANYDLLDEETKKLVDDWEAYSTAADEALSQVGDSITELAGGLLPDFSDALVDGFVNGADAADQMKTSVEGIIEAMLQQMLTATLLAPAFSSLEQDMYKSMGLKKNADGTFSDIGGGDQDFTDDMGRFYDNFDIGGIMDQSNDLLQKWQDDFKELYGLDIFTADDEDSLSGLSKGIQGVTEDTANIIAAYLNTIRSEVIIQNSYLANMISVLQVTQGVASQQLTQLVAIQNNTYRIAEILEAAQNGTKALNVA